MSGAGAAAKNGSMTETVTDEVSGLKSTPSKPSSTSKPTSKPSGAVDAENANAEKKIVEVPDTNGQASNAQATFAKATKVRFSFVKVSLG